MHYIGVALHPHWSENVTLFDPSSTNSVLANHYSNYIGKYVWRYLRSGNIDSSINYFKYSHLNSTERKCFINGTAEQRVTNSLLDHKVYIIRTQKSFAV